MKAKLGYIGLGFVLTILGCTASATVLYQCPTAAQIQAGNTNLQVQGGGSAVAMTLENPFQGNVKNFQTLTFDAKSGNVQCIYTTTTDDAAIYSSTVTLSNCFLNGNPTLTRCVAGSMSGGCMILCK